MYSIRFGEDAPERRSVEQLRGIEGARVKRLCELPTRENAVNCRGRDHDPANCSGPDTPNRCLSAATTCLYGLAEAASFARGCTPAIGLVYAGRPQSFVYDHADVCKFETVVPIAFEITGRAAKGRFAGDPMGETRRGSREYVPQDQPA